MLIIVYIIRLYKYKSIKIIYFVLCRFWRVCAVCLRPLYTSTRKKQKND